MTANNKYTRRPAPRILRAKLELEEILKPLGYTLDLLLSNEFHFVATDIHSGERFYIYSQTYLSFDKRLIGLSAFVLIKHSEKLYLYDHDYMMNLLIAVKKTSGNLAFGKFGVYTISIKNRNDEITQALEIFEVSRNTANPFNRLRKDNA